MAVFGIAISKNGTPLSRPWMREQTILGRQGKAYVKERYSWARIEACYLEAIKQGSEHKIAKAS